MLQPFKGCVPLKIFASSFLSLKESTCEIKCFLFHFKSSFCSQENQSLEFKGIQISWRNQMSKYKTRNTFYWITC